MPTANAENHLRLDKMNLIIDMQSKGKTQAEISAAINDNVIAPPVPAVAEPTSGAELDEIFKMTANTIPESTAPVELPAVSDARAKFANAKELQLQSELLLKEAYALDPSLKPRRGRPRKTNTE